MSSVNDRMYQALGAEIRVSKIDIIGNDATFTVPSGEIWEGLNLTVVFVSSSTVATRQLYILSKTDSADDLMIRSSPITQAASLSYLYAFNLGGYDEGALGAFNTIGLTLPYTLLLPGYTFTVSAQNRQNNDQIIATLNYRLTRVV